MCAECALYAIRKLCRITANGMGRDCVMCSAGEDSMAAIPSLLSRHPVHMRLALACLATALVCSVVGAQVPTTWVPGNVETRSHDYDLVHQRIELRDISWDSTSLNGRVTTTLIARRPALDSVILDAAPGIVVQKAADAAGRALRTSRSGDSLVIHFTKPLRFGDTTRFTLDYHDAIESGRGLTFIYADGRPHRPQQLWSMGETTGNSAWFPTYDYPNDKETWELLATVPARFTVVSNGRLVSDVRNKDGSHTTHWSQEQPSATYLISLTIAPYARIHDQWRGIPVDYYVYHEDSALARPLFGYTPDMIETYIQTHRRAVPVGQVRAGDRRRLLRRRGEGERDGARRLATRQARATPIARGTTRSSFRTSSRTSGSATTRPRRTGRTSGSTRDSPSS